MNFTYAQVSMRSLIKGENGKSASFTRLSPDKQQDFIPSQAKSLLGIDANSDLVLMNTDTDQLGEVHHRFNQTYKGIPIENSMYIMHTSKNKLTGMSGIIVLDFDKQMAQRTITSTLSPANAVQAALSYVHAETYAWQDTVLENQVKSRSGDINSTYYPIATLVWYSPGKQIEPGDLHLAYKVDVFAKKPLSRAYYFIDAQSGQVLGKKDELFYSDVIGTANTAYSGVQNIHSDLVSGTYSLKDLTKGNGIHTGSAVTSNYYTSATANWNLTGADQYALDAHYGVSQTYDFFKSKFNRNSINNSGYALYSYVNDPATNETNVGAYWNGNMVFGTFTGSGAGITSIDVTAHEITHGLTSFTSGLIYSYESGAMNESMSDIMGKSVQFWSKPADINWVLGNDMNWLIRNMANPNQYSQPDTYLGTYWYAGSVDNGGVHTNSGVGNFMFYLLVNGGSGTNDIANNFTVNGIGLTKADAIIYRTETVYMTPTSQYADWRTACINAATDLYGATSNEVVQVKNAWFAVGIGAYGSLPCTGTKIP